MKPRAIRGLYGMVDLAPSDSPSALIEEATRLTLALLDGGARVLQLRMKQASASAMLDCGQVVRKLTTAREALFFINDRVDVALVLGADGAHLGQDDLPLRVARQLVPEGFVLGISTHTLPQARTAAEEGADYIGFGPCFPSGSKQDRWPAVGAAALAEVCAVVAVPVVAIGGITLENVADVARAAVAAVAVIGAVKNAVDPLAAAVALCAAFYAARPSL